MCFAYWLAHRVKAASRSTIARLHPVAMIFAVTVEACSPYTALLMEVLFSGFAAFALVDGASGCVDARAHRPNLISCRFLAFFYRANVWLKLGLWL